ncbi:MAG: NAD-dependent epimerase/dehydratase family protein, partial [Usitatibacteraceae bacterium]
MQPNADFWRGKRVCITGGTGFLGWHIAQALLPLAAHVRVLGLKSAHPHKSADAGIETIYADIRDATAVREALADCDVVFHAAASVAVWGPALNVMHEIHTQGTRNVLAALPANARLVHTSSVVAIGATRDGASLNEASAFELQSLQVDYVHAKENAEGLALSAAAQGRDVVVVNPGYLIGPNDEEGSVMGRFCLRCWQGWVPLVPAGGLNFVDVRDVALGHLLAAERGVCGRRYILGGANLPMTDFVRALASVHGMSARAPEMPAWLNALVALGAEAIALVTRREPYPSFQHYRLTRFF